MRSTNTLKYSCMSEWSATAWECLLRVNDLRLEEMEHKKKAVKADPCGTNISRTHDHCDQIFWWRGEWKNSQCWKQFDRTRGWDTIVLLHKCGGFHCCRYWSYAISCMSNADAILFTTTKKSTSSATSSCHQLKQRLQEGTTGFWWQERFVESAEKCIWLQKRVLVCSTYMLLDVIWGIRTRTRITTAMEMAGLLPRCNPPPLSMMFHTNQQSIIKF